MKPPDIIEVTMKVVHVFNKLGIPYHIGGSLASSAFGVARSTIDVDIVADIKPEHASLITELLKEEFYVDLDMVRDAIQHRSTFNLIHLETMFKVDVYVLKERLFEKQAFVRRIQKSVSEDSSLKLFFATPEDIILHKLQWYKSGGGVSERQWTDIIGVLKVQREGLDTSYLKTWAEKLGVSELLKKAFKEAEVDF